MVVWVQAPPAGTGARPHPLRRERDLSVREAVVSFFSPATPAPCCRKGGNKRDSVPWGINLFGTLSRLEPR